MGIAIVNILALLVWAMLIVCLIKVVISIGKIADAMDRIANVIDNSSEDSNELKRKLEEMKGKES